MHHVSLLKTFLCTLYLCTRSSTRFQTVPVKSVTLNTTNTNENNAVLGVLRPVDVNVDVFNKEWDITCTGETNYHLGINLDDTWGFHPTKMSSIKFGIYGSSSFSSTGYDLLLTFSVNGNQFITVMLSSGLDSSNLIGPSLVCDTSTTPNQTLGTGDVQTCVDESICEICTVGQLACSRRQNKANIGTDGNIQQTEMLPTNNFPGGVWPWEVIIINDPINDYSFIQATNPKWEPYYQQCGFNSFASNSGLRMYVALADPGEYLSLNQFDIDYYYNITNAPTPNPTNMPITSNPSTSNPTTSTPVTLTPITSAPVTIAPVTSNPTTSSPVTSTPITNIPITSSPVTSTYNPTTAPVTLAPVTLTPVTSMPTTPVPVTSSPVTLMPISVEPTTNSPVTSNPITAAPTDPKATPSPTESITSTAEPSTNNPVTATPLTIVPITTAPITSIPTTVSPTVDVTNTPITLSPMEANTQIPITLNSITSAPVTSTGVPTYSPLIPETTSSHSAGLDTTASETTSEGVNTGDSKQIASNSETLDTTIMVAIIACCSIITTLLCIGLIVLVKKKINKNKELVLQKSNTSIMTGDGEYKETIPPSSPMSGNAETLMTTPSGFTTPFGSAPVDIMNDNGPDLLMNMIQQKNATNIQMVQSIPSDNDNDDNWNKPSIKSNPVTATMNGESDNDRGVSAQLPPVGVGPVIKDMNSDSDLYKPSVLPPVPVITTQTKGYIEPEESLSDNKAGNNGEQDIAIVTPLNENNKKSNIGYEWIENALKQIDKNEWEMYLVNFKKEKMTESRLKHMSLDKEHFWDRLLPQMGVKLEFQALWKKRQNNQF